MIRQGRDFWTNEQEQGRTLGVVYDNHRGQTEGTLQYAERIAVLAGLLSPGKASFAENRTLEPSKLESRKPYRDDFE